MPAHAEGVIHRAAAPHVMHAFSVPHAAACGSLLQPRVAAVRRPWATVGFAFGKNFCPQFSAAAALTCSMILVCWSPGTSS